MSKRMASLSLCCALLLAPSLSASAAQGIKSDDEIISIGGSKTRPKVPDDKQSTTAPVDALTPPASESSPELKALEAKAQTNDSQAQFELGRALARGMFGKKDETEAVRWVEAAARQNLPEAQHLLGVMYRDGIGAPKNYFQAIKWLRQSSDTGFRLAGIDLGMMFFQGKGVHQDLVEAYVLLNLASPTIQFSPASEFPEARHALVRLPTLLSDEQKSLASGKMQEARDQALEALMKRHPGKSGPLPPK